MLPTITSGSACPRSPWKPIDELTAPTTLGTTIYTVIGTGPAYPIVYNFDQVRGNISFRHFVDGGSRRPRGRFGEVRWVKVRWPIDPAYAGPLLIRGARLDGPGDLLFDQADPLEMRVASDGAGGNPSLQGWRDAHGGFGVGAPGCYGIQIDGTGFTITLVFEVTS